MGVILMIPAHEIIQDEYSLVHEWRVGQLTRLGIPEPLADALAARVTGTRSPRWCSAAARHGWPCASSYERPIGRPKLRLPAQGRARERSDRRRFR